MEDSEWSSQYTSMATGEVQGSNPGRGDNLLISG